MRSGGCGDARSARAAYRRVRGEPRARASTGTPRARFSRRVARYASRDARRGARASEPRDVPLSGRRSRAGGEDAPNFVRLALGLRAFDEPVGVRGDHGARYERGRVLHDRGSRRGALGRPRARLADGRHGVTGGARAGSVVRGFAEHGREVCGARVRAYLSTARRRGLSGVRCLTRSVSNVRTVRARAVRSTRDADLARGKHKGKLRLFTGFSHSTGQICPVLVLSLIHI